MEVGKVNGGWFQVDMRHTEKKEWWSQWENAIRGKRQNKRGIGGQIEAECGKKGDLETNEKKEG